MKPDTQKVLRTVHPRKEEFIHIGKRSVSPSALGGAGPPQSRKSQPARTEIFMCVLPGL